MHRPLAGTRTPFFERSRLVAARGWCIALRIHAPYKSRQSQPKSNAVFQKRRQLAGESAPDRYEIDIVGLQGQLARLEISSAPIEYEGATALLVTGVEITLSLSANATISGRSFEYSMNFPWKKTLTMSW